MDTETLSFAKTPQIVFGWPLIVNYHLFYTLYQHTVKLLVECSTFPAFQGFCVNLFPQIITFIRRFAIELSAKR